LFLNKLKAPAIFLLSACAVGVECAGLEMESSRCPTGVTTFRASSKIRLKTLLNSSGLFVRRGMVDTCYIICFTRNLFVVHHPSSLHLCIHYHHTLLLLYTWSLLPATFCKSNGRSFWGACALSSFTLTKLFALTVFWYWGAPVIHVHKIYTVSTFVLEEQC
jgi:hypothetical protein